VHKKKVKATNLSLISWALYDAGSSAFATLIQTFLFAAYFTRAVAPSEIEGSSAWGFSLGVAGVIIAVGGPILGAIADHKGDRKGWLFIFYLLSFFAIACMWFVKPNPAYMTLGLILIALSTIGSEFAYIFYSAMLPALTSKKNVGTWSGIGWGTGYLGGMICLILALLAFLNDQNSWFHLDPLDAAPERAAFLLAAIWYGLFAIPLFIFTPNQSTAPQTFSKAIQLGFKQLKNSIVNIRHYRHLFWFLFSRMIFTDGLTTLFLFGGVYAAGAFDMSSHDVLLFGVALNITAGIGAFAFAWLDDMIGSKPVILISLVCLTLCTIGMLLSQTLTEFWISGLTLGAFVGPLQSSCRALLAKVTPPDKINQMFGLLTFSGKATGFMGPFFVSLITYWTASQRWGIAVIIPFFVVGLLMMLKVPSEKNFERL